MKHRHTATVVVAAAVLAVLYFVPRKSAPPQKTDTPPPIPSTKPASPTRAPLKKIDKAERERLLKALAALHPAAPSPVGPAPVPGAPPAGESPSSSAAAPAVGQLDKDYIRGRLADVKPLVKECYELALAKDPKLQGRLDLEFVIVADKELGGVVESATSRESSTIKNGTLDECMQATISSIQFDPPAGGGRVMVRYPFQFRNDP